MPTNYPGATDSFTSHSTGQTIQSADINNIQSAVTALENSFTGQAFYNVGNAQGLSTPVDTAVQSVLNVVNGASQQAYFSAGDWYYSLPSQALTLTAGGIALKGCGMQSTRLNFADVATAPYGFNIFGGSFSNATHSSTTVTLAVAMSPTDAHLGYQASLTPSGSGSIFSIGQWVQLIDPNEVTNFNGRWMGQIAGITGDVLTFEAGTPLTFPIGTTMIYGGLSDSITISDMTIQSTASGPAAHLGQLINLVYYKNVVIERVKFRNALNNLVSATSCFNVTFRDCEFEDADSGTSSDGLAFFGCMYARAINCTFTRSRFGVAGVQSPYTTIDGCNFSDTRWDSGTGLGGRAFKVQQGSVFSTITQNKQTGFGSPFFVADSPHTLVAGNRIRQSGVSPGSAFNSSAHGIWIGSSYVTNPIPSSSDHCQVHDNDIEGVGGWGIFVGGNNHTTGDFECNIHDNTIIGAAQGGIAVNSDVNHIHNNIIDSCGQNPISTTGGILTNSSATGNLIAHNKFKNMGTVAPINTSNTGGNRIGNNDFIDVIATNPPIFNTGPSGDTKIAQGGASLDYASGLPASSSTIPVAGYYHIRIYPSANLTGMTLGLGIDQQEVVIQNVTGYTLGWGASGSNVASYSTSGLAANQTRRFIFDAQSGLWWVQT